MFPMIGKTVAMNLVFLLTTFFGLLLGGAAFDLPGHTDVPPPPLPTGCFLNSVVNPLWELSRVQYGDASLSLVLTNPADQSAFRCAGAWSHSDKPGPLPLTCLTGNGTGTTANVTLVFNTAFANLGIRQTWVCTDNQHMTP